MCAPGGYALLTTVSYEHFKYLCLYLYVCSFLQRGRIACNAERCNTYGNSIRPSVSLSVTLWYPIQTNEDRITGSSL